VQHNYNGYVDWKLNKQGIRYENGLECPVCGEVGQTLRDKEARRCEFCNKRLEREGDKLLVT
jgi:phage FluMu protein Com